MKRRMFGILTAAIVAVLVLVAGTYVTLGRARTHGQVMTSTGDLNAVVRSLVQQMPRPDSGGYAQPSSEEATQMADAFGALLDGRVDDAVSLGDPLSYDVVRFTDTTTGQSLLMLQERRNPDGSWPHAWGLYVAAPASRSQLLVEVAHPLDDIQTPLVGVSTFRRAGGRALLVAGASRYADDGDIADMAHDSFSVFEAIHERSLTPDSVVFQPHGFEIANHASLGDVVVSSGTAPPDPTARAVAEALTKADFGVCLYEGSNCSDLGGTTNVQGTSTRARGAIFLHVEMALSVRSSRARREAIARAVASATS